jgi:phospholipid/cholesterol/gamma-HCH transport system permease protein
MAAADFEYAKGETGPVLRLKGDWTTAGLGRAGVRLAAATRARAPVQLELAELGGFDTAGALALVDAGVAVSAAQAAGRTDVSSLLALVAAARPSDVAVAPADPGGLYGGLVRLGRGVADISGEVYRALAFQGRLFSVLARLVVQPRRLRPAATVALMERTGLDALPIIVVTSFFVGATLAFLGQNMLSQYGGQVFAVELVATSVLREFGVAVTAIILAGRSASSFAAEIGAMRMHQEVDAMEVMGVDPFDALVIPRFLALMVMTPLLTFTAMVAGLLGGMLVIWGAVGLSPAFFVQRVLDRVAVGNFYVGMIKTPVLATIIAAIGCRQGLEVGGDVESLGRKVTTAVVQALFATIVSDAAFAFLFVEIGL